MLMTGEHYWNCLENHKFQAKVRPIFTLKNCKHMKKQMIKITSIFNFINENRNPEVVSKAGVLGHFKNTICRLGKGKTNWEIPD